MLVGSIPLRASRATPSKSGSTCGDAVPKVGVMSERRGPCRSTITVAVSESADVFSTASCANASMKCGPSSVSVRAAVQSPVSPASDTARTAPSTTTETVAPGSALPATFSSSTAMASGGATITGASGGVVSTVNVHVSVPGLPRRSAKFAATTCGPSNRGAPTDATTTPFLSSVRRKDAVNGASSRSSSMPSGSIPASESLSPASIVGDALAMTSSGAGLRARPVGGVTSAAVRSTVNTDATVVSAPLGSTAVTESRYTRPATSGVVGVKVTSPSSAENTAATSRPFRRIPTVTFGRLNPASIVAVMAGERVAISTPVSGLVICTAGGAESTTTTCRGDSGPSPAGSRTKARIVCGPSLNDRVCSRKEPSPWILPWAVSIPSTRSTTVDPGLSLVPDTTTIGSATNAAISSTAGAAGRTLSNRKPSASVSLPSVGVSRSSTVSPLASGRSNRVSQAASY